MGVGVPRGEGDELPPMMVPNDGMWAPSSGFRPLRILGSNVTVRDDIPKPMEPDVFSGVRRTIAAHPGVPDVPLGRMRGYDSQRAPTPLTCAIPGCRVRLADPREIFEHWAAHHPKRPSGLHITKSLPRPPR